MSIVRQPTFDKHERRQLYQAYGLIEVMQPQQPSWQASPEPTPDYSFLTEQPQPQKRSLLPGGNSLAVRVGVVAGGLLVLIILFAIVRGLLSGGKNYDSFVVITQQQQEMIHLTTAASEQDSLSENVKNFAITAQLGLTTDQSKTISYLKKNGVKVKSKTLAQGVKVSLDTQLQAAATANNYESTFKQVMHDQLESYLTALRQTYANTSGSHGRQLLSQDYDNAALLLNQLNTPS